MNQWDQENLRFLMQADEAQLKKWQQKMTPDDMEYAAELLNKAREALESPDWRIIADMVLMPDDVGMDVSQAATLLKKFQL